jgi:putative acetyltransferase
MIRIREEKPDDYNAVKNVNDMAFNQPLEGNIIDKLRHSDANILSLVAETDGNIAGHIFFSTAEVGGENGKIKGMGLAPMAVLPAYQKQGVGKRLITEGIERMKKQSVPFIIVIGHAHYYPKFGFEVASKYGLKCQWAGVRDEVFMVLILDNAKMKGVRGVVRYREEWNEAM